MPNSNSSSSITRIIQIIIALAGLWVTISSDFGSEEPSKILISFLLILFLVFLVGVIENLFRPEHKKTLNILSNGIAVLVSAFIIIFFAVLIKPNLACDFHKSFHEKVFDLETPMSCLANSVNQDSNITDEQIPEKGVKSLSGTPYKTIAYYYGGAGKEEFICHEKPPSGSRLVIIGFKEVQNLGKTRKGTFCDPGPPFCDSHNEYCVNYAFTEACFVRNEWYDWYKKYCETNNLPFTEAAVCQ